MTCVYVPHYVLNISQREKRLWPWYMCKFAVIYLIFVMTKEVNVILDFFVYILINGFTNNSWSNNFYMYLFCCFLRNGWLKMKVINSINAFYLQIFFVTLIIVKIDDYPYIWSIYGNKKTTVLEWFIMTQFKLLPFSR